MRFDNLLQISIKPKIFDIVNSYFRAIKQDRYPGSEITTQADKDVEKSQKRLVREDKKIMFHDNEYPLICSKLTFLKLLLLLISLGIINIDLNFWTIIRCNLD